MKKEEFEGLRFSPFGQIGNEAIWKKYTEFAQRPMLSSVAAHRFDKDEDTPPWQDLDLMIRYIILFCTRKGNPLSRERDFEMKKKQVCEMLGIKANDRVRAKYIDKWHPWFIQVMAVYLRLVNERDYTSWLALKMSYDQDMVYLMMPLNTVEDPEKTLLAKNRIRDSMEKREESLRKIEAALFPDDKSLAAITELETGAFDGTGSYAEFRVAEDWPR